MSKKTPAPKAVENEVQGLNTGDNLPFALFNPAAGEKLIWICGFDATNKITSIFQYDMGTFKDKRISYLKDEAEAKHFRDTMLAEGWKPLKMPKMRFKYAGQTPDEEGKPMNRRMRRMLQKRVDAINKQSAFGNEDPTPPEEDFTPDPSDPNYDPENDYEEGE